MTDRYIFEKGGLARLPALAAELGCRHAQLVADPNTYPLAGDRITASLTEAGIAVSSFVLPDGMLEPNERAVGSLMLHFDPRADLVIGIGSGVINDLSKLLASLTARPYIIVATAPSMDGYASPLSSMVRDGMKVSIPTKRAEIILADPDLLATAPDRMLKAGLGDMLAKYVSILEWHLGALITGEAFDPAIAASVRDALSACVTHADGLLLRREASLRAVFDGLVLTGEAMARAGVSRPASGAEHYFSHLWDMRALELGTPSDLHGLQCAAATRICISLYLRLAEHQPDRERALGAVSAFDGAAWEDSLCRFLGRAAQPLIELEKREGKYDPVRHRARLETILSHFDEIRDIIRQELPTLSELDSLYSRLGLPTDAPEAGVLPMTLAASKDIRDKYVLPRLLWDLGILDEFCQSLE